MKTTLFAAALAVSALAAVPAGAVSMCELQCNLSHDSGSIARDGCYARCAAEEGLEDLKDGAGDLAREGAEVAGEAYETGKEKARDALDYLKGFLGSGEEEAPEAEMEEDIEDEAVEL